MTPAFDAALAACPKGHFLELDASPGPRTSHSCSASYCEIGEGSVRVVRFFAAGRTPDEALRALVGRVRGEVEVADAA